MAQDDVYYRGFVTAVVETLNLDEDKEEKFKKLCELWGVNWKLDVGM